MREITILGMGLSAASFLSQNVQGEIWGINYAYLYSHRIDRLFMLHPWEHFIHCATKPHRQQKYFLRELSTSVKEVWTVKKLEVGVRWDNLPIKPNEEIDMVYKFGSPINWDEVEENEKDYYKLIDSKLINKNDLTRLMGTQYLTCTLAYLIGQAIVEKVDRITLYGIDIWDFGGVTDYGEQVPCVNAWLHLARSRGIEVLMPWMSVIKSADRIFKNGNNGR